MSLFEAAACGTPMIISDNKATRNLLLDEEKATWIDLDDSKEGLAEKYVLQCARYAEKFKP